MRNLVSPISAVLVQASNSHALDDGVDLVSALGPLRFPAVEHHAILDLVVQPAAFRVAHRDDERGLLFLEVPPSPCERAARAGPRHERIDGAICLPPDLWTRAVVVRVEVAAVLLAPRMSATSRMRTEIGAGEGQESAPRTDQRRIRGACARSHAPPGDP